MAVKAYLTVINLALIFVSSTKGQYFPDGPRNNYNPQPQSPGNFFPQQQFSQPNSAPGSQLPNFNRDPQQGQLFPDRPRNNFNPPFRSSENPFPPSSRQETFTPIPQSPGFNRNVQGTSSQVPNFNHFQPTIFSIIPELSTLFPQRSTVVPPGRNQPTSFAPTDIFNPTNNPQRQSSHYPNPMQNIPFNRGTYAPDNIFRNTQPSTPFFNPPKQTTPVRPPPTSNFFTPTEIIHPSTLRFIPDPNKPFTGPQQSSPNYARPQETGPTVPGFQQNRPQPTSTGIFDPATLKFIEDAFKTDFDAPKPSNPSYISPQGNVPISQGPPKVSSGPLTPQHPYQDSAAESQPIMPDSTVIQQSPLAVPHPTTTDSTIPQTPLSDSIVPPQKEKESEIPQKPIPDSIVSQPALPQQPKPDSAVPQQTDSSSIVPQQTDINSKIPQQTDSDSTSSQKTVDDSDNTQLITSASEASSSISNVPQDSGSVSDAPEQPIHPSHNHNLTTQYTNSEEQDSNDPLGGKRIVCLFNNRHFYRNGFTPSKLEPHLCTHLNYEFAILDPKTYEMIVGEPDLDIALNFYQEATDLKDKNPDLKVLVSLGGWSDSTKKYSELAKDPAKRANFVDKAVQFLKGHKFDGMDFAWEYPNCWQGAIGINPADKQNFVDLLKDIKEGFNAHGLLLSVSVGAIKREVEAAYDVPAISKVVDYINVMTYDMHGPWESKTGHHVQFEPKEGDKDPYCNVKGGMKVWIEKGAEKRKLNMGLALYGRTYRTKDANQCEMGAPAIGPGAPGPVTKEGGILNYHEICNFLNSGDWTEKLDREAGFFACSGDQWAAYDPPMMMVRKVSYVVNSGLGGVLLKDLSGDDSNAECFNMPFPILRMVKMQMMHKVAKSRQKNSHHIA